jgi:hypothetical protein
MPTFTSPFTGDIVQPTDVSYLDLPFSADVVLAWPSYVAPNSTEVAAARIIDCTPSTSGLTIKLPPGSQGSVGTDILFRNLGAVSFVVEDQSGDQSVTLAAGDARYFYLVDNTTEDGIYHNFAYGVGTSSADAASLVGAGLTNIAGRLATTTTIVETSAAPTLTDSSRALAYIWAGGLQSIDLPTASSLSAGWYILFRNNGTGAVTFFPQGTSTVNGSPSQTFNPGDSGIVVFDYITGDFYTIGLAPSTNVTFSAATYDVDSIVGNTLSLVSNAPIIQTYEALSGTRTQTLAVTLPAITQLYILTNNTNQSSYNITFQISGSSQSPITFAAGVVGIVLSDGNYLYVLSQSTAGVFFANDGSASAPSFSFNSDDTTGMYLKSVGQLGFAANGTEMLLIDDSNPSAPAISTVATFNAEGGIGGGTF